MCSSEGGGYSSSCRVLFCCLWCAFWFLNFHGTIEVGSEEWDLYERELNKQFVPSQLTLVHNVYLTFAVDLSW